MIAGWDGGEGMVPEKKARTCAILILIIFRVLGNAESGVFLRAFSVLYA